jgi:hypothetical protein
MKQGKARRRACPTKCFGYAAQRGVVVGASASEINTFLGRVISQIRLSEKLKSYALGSIGVNDGVCVPCLLSARKSERQHG